jgi:hypothetical protein
MRTCAADARRDRIAQFERVRTNYADRIACVPFQAEEPVGLQRLLELAR